ncbi:MAG: hypothetical protein ABJP48_07825 [Erythrobacter sp.]
MFKDQVGAAAIDAVPSFVLPSSRYGLGVWCEGSEGSEGSEGFGEPCSFVHSVGAWGTFPWVDRSDGSWGVVFLFGRLSAVQAAEQTIVRNVERCI